MRWKIQLKSGAFIRNAGIPLAEDTVELLGILNGSRFIPVSMDDNVVLISTDTVANVSLERV